MARYIDADALIKKIFPVGLVDDGRYAIPAKAVKISIDNAPTVDVVPRSEVAEIFEEIENMINIMCAATGLEMTYFGKYAEIRRKYIGGQDDSI